MKTKELDWHIKWDYLLNKKKWKNPDEVNKVLTKFVEDLLIQQRTELLEEIKKMELKHSINPNSPSRERKIIYNQAIRDVINLINKKDE